MTKNNHLRPVNIYVLAAPSISPTPFKFNPQFDPWPGLRNFIPIINKTQSAADVSRVPRVYLGNYKTLSLLLSLPPFLVAVFKRLCPSVRPSGVIELKCGKMSVFDTFCVCLSVGSGFGCGWGLDASAHPSATIL